jgi:hypothetical protein
MEVTCTDVDGLLARILMPTFFGGLAAGGAWFLYLLVAFPPTVVAGAVLAGLVLTTLTWLFGWLALRIAAMSWRSGRGSWWLRLSHNGFEVNDRIFRPRRYEWRDIDKFMLVVPSSEVGAEHHPVVRVGFARAPGHRRSLARRLFADFSGLDGTKADGMIMGFWDRPFDEAVDLLNGWRVRHAAA